MSLPNPFNGFVRNCFVSFLFIRKDFPLFILMFVMALQSSGQKIDIKSGAQLVMKGRPFLVINNAALSNNGVLIADSGTVHISGNADSSIAYIDGSGNTHFNNLIINKPSSSVAIRGSVSVKDSLNITSGILYTNDYLTLSSNENRTATLTELPVNGSGIATAYVSGKVSIERYLAPWRSWRLLGVPVKSTNAPSINQSWQEGVTTSSSNPNPNPGYGTHIIGGSVANGYDQGLTSSSSIKIFNNAFNVFSALPAGGTNLPISNYSGYFLFVKADRSANIMNNNTPAGATVLRMKGEVKTGDQAIDVNRKGFTLMGNPYPSAINFRTIVRNNVRNHFYTWDPYLDGAHGMGAWVTISWNGTSYDATPSVSAVSECIPSGAAVFVQAEDTSAVASIIIKESDKTNCSSQAPFTGRERVTGKLRTSFLEKKANGSRALLDGLITSFDDSFSNEMDAYDVLKMNTKYVAQKRYGQSLSIERRQAISDMDTIFLQLNPLAQRSYEWQFVFSGMEGKPVEAILKDNFSSTLNNRLLSLADTNFIQFDVNNNAASGATNRFMIVFKQLQVLPVSFNQIKAAENAAGILVQWETEQEINIKHYVLEKSINGTQFYPIHTQAAKGNGSVGKNVYQYQDNAAVTGNQFYRVKAVEVDGAIKQSNTVLVNIADSKSGMVVFPNPVTSNFIGLQTNTSATGMYHYRLLTNNGQVLQKGTFQVQRPNQQLQVPVANSITKGIYQLEIQHTSNNAVVHKIILQ